jgi:hypothetical protein
MTAIAVTLVVRLALPAVGWYALRYGNLPHAW